MQKPYLEEAHEVVQEICYWGRNSKTFVSPVWVSFLFLVVCWVFGVWLGCGVFFFWPHVLNVYTNRTGLLRDVSTSINVAACSLQG